MELEGIPGIGVAGIPVAPFFLKRVAPLRRVSLKASRSVQALGQRIEQLEVAVLEQPQMWQLLDGRPMTRDPPRWEIWPWVETNGTYFGAGASPMFVFFFFVGIGMLTGGAGC